MIEALSKLAELLEAWGHPGAVIGGVAITLRVRARATQDADIILVVPPGEHDRLLELLPPDRSRGFGLDVMFADNPFFERLVRRATKVETGDAVLPVATLEDLLLLKLDANRGIDLDDAVAIKDAFGDVLDREYLRAQAETLGLTARLKAILGP